MISRLDSAVTSKIAIIVLGQTYLNTGPYHTWCMIHLTGIAQFDNSRFKH